MSFRDCIDNALKEGRITKEQAEALRARYGDAEDELALEYGPHAGQEAARRVFDEFEFETLEARRRKVRQAQVAGERSKEQDAFRNFTGNEDPGEYLALLMEDIGGKLGTSSLHQRYLAIRGLTHEIFQEGIRRFERDVWLRTRNKSDLDNVIRALFGHEADATAKGIADAWTEAAEYLRRRFNAAGGHIAKLDSWGLPQAHDPVAIARVGKEAWKEFVRARLDRSKMISHGTGKPMTNGQIELLLDQVYRTITEHGENKNLPKGAKTSAILANMRADHRVLHFAGPDQWLEYQTRFGNGDAFGAMMQHLDSMARDVSAMEILGPNPRSTIELLSQRAIKWARAKDAAEPTRTVPYTADQQGKVWQARNTYDLHTGAMNHPVHSTLAKAMRSTRNYLTAVQLQSAMLSAATDIFTQKHARAYAGLPVARSFRNTVKSMFPPEATKADFLRMGLIADGASQVALAQSRYLTEFDHTGMSAKLVDFTLRATLLSPWTQAGRWAFGQEMLGHMASKADQSFEQLMAGDDASQRFGRLLQRYGLHGSWDIIRSTPMYEPEPGATFLRPSEIARRTDVTPDRAQYLADRVLEMLHTETSFAIPTASQRMRAISLGGTRPGTWIGELVRSTAMYKSFSVTIAYQIASRSMQEAADVAARGGNGRQAGLQMAASFAMGLTLFGALSVQLKEVRDGRDLRDMTASEDGRKFWAQAMMQGGGLGIFGDFFLADVNRFGQDWGSTVAGPVFGAGQDVFGYGKRVWNTAVPGGDDQKLGRETVKMLRRYTPGSQFWYWRLMVDRMFYDQMQLMVDDDAQQYFARQMQTRNREAGEGYWWNEGALFPSRLPDPTAAIIPDPEDVE